MSRRIREFAFAVALALAAPVVLYILFKDANIAIFEKDAVKLGGPAALFFIVLGTALRYFSRKVRDPFADLRDALAGTWNISAVSHDGDKATSSCSIYEKNGRLRISGGQFVSDDVASGTWKVSASCLTDDSLTYVYELREAGGAAWKGIVDLTVPQTGKLDVLTGMWEVVGKDYHGGTIRLTRNGE